MATKTHPTDVPVEAFLDAVTPERRREEGFALLSLMREVTGDPGVMWGPSMVGFGSMHYNYASGRQGDWLKVGFSPRKAKLTFYGLQDADDAAPHLARLGPHTLGAGCVYANKLSDLDESALRELTRIAYDRGDYVA